MAAHLCVADPVAGVALVTLVAASANESPVCPGLVVLSHAAVCVWPSPS